MRLFSIILALILALSLVGCGQQINDAGTFSWEETQEQYKAQDAGAKTEGFANITEMHIGNAREAIERAKNEVTIKYNAVNVAFDADEVIWEILFYTRDTLGGCQSVYLDQNGITRLIVYGE